MEWPEGWNAGAFTELTVFQTAQLSIGEAAQRQETVLACLADSSFFDVLSVGPARGRLFNREDAQIGAPPVAAVSQAFWKSHFGNSEDLSNAKFYAAGHWIQVVGVLPAKVDFPAHAAVYLPRPDQRLTLGASDAEKWSPDDLSRGEDRVIGRLRPGVTVAQARGMEKALLESIRKANTDPHRGIGSVVVVRRLQDTMTIYVKDQFTMITVAGCFVALVALFSLFFLSAARAAEMRKDIAIRIALGAGTASLLRREITWWLWVGATASAMVLALTEAALQSARRMEALAIPRLGDLSLSLPQAVWIVAGTMSVAVLLALPYLFVCRKVEPVTPILNRGESQSRLTMSPAIGKLISVGQLSLALALTAVALHVCVNYWRLATTPPGIDPSRVFVSDAIPASSLNLGNPPALPHAAGSASTDQNSSSRPNTAGFASASMQNPNSRSKAANPSSTSLPSLAPPKTNGSASALSGGLFQSAVKEESPEDRAARSYIVEQEVSEAANEASHQPGVGSIALIDPVPYEAMAGGSQFIEINGRVSDMALPLYSVRGDIPRALGIRVLTGRWFDSEDEKSGADVIVVGDMFSKKYFRGQAIGKSVVVEGTGDSGTRTIIGVVDDVLAGYGEEIGPTMYIPMSPRRGYLGSVVARMAPGVTRPPFALPKSPESLLQFQGWLSMAKMMSDAGATDRASAMVAAWFAALVLLLAAAGAYAIFWMLTIQRQREMAIRICFGALPWKVATGMLVNGIALAAYAGVGGFVIQQGLQRVLSSSIYKFPAFSWPIFLISFGVISVATLLSVARPARSILRLSPTELLRDN